MCILDWRWHFNGACHVVIGVAELVGQLLDLTWITAGAVVNYHVVCGADDTLSRDLRHKEEVVSVGGHHICVNDCAR